MACCMRLAVVGGSPSRRVLASGRAGRAPAADRSSSAPPRTPSRRPPSRRHGEGAARPARSPGLGAVERTSAGRRLRLTRARGAADAQDALDDRSPAEPAVARAMRHLVTPASTPSTVSATDTGAPAPATSSSAAPRLGRRRAATHMQLFVLVWHELRARRPATPADRAEFAAYAAALGRGSAALRHVIIGNEPNLNRFWMPQFGADGSDARRRRRTRRCSRARYDALKAARPERQRDRRRRLARAAPTGRTGSARRIRRRPSSPTSAPPTGRAAAERRSWTPSPSTRTWTTRASRRRSTHPKNTTIAIADYAKLVALLGKAFDGTAQPGSTLPIVYGEFGVETDPGAKARSTPAPSRRREAGHDDAGRTTGGARARVLPAERDDVLFFHASTRQPRPLAVGCLRRRTPKPSLAVSRPRATREAA